MTATGIFGGSFNPIHNGHIALAEAMLRQTDLDEVWLMVSPQNPLKQDRDLLADSDRLCLAEKALAGIRGITACDYEFHLPRPSYTWHTLESLVRDYPERRFSLIIGGDNWQHFHRWYRHDDILRHHALYVYPRADEPSAAEHPSPLSLPPEASVTFVRAPLLPVSSTVIRLRVARGESIEGMVPPQIAADVCRLYASLKDKENG